mgnify:FL=1
MVTINIYLRKYGSEPTSGVVWLSFYINREKVNFSTKVSVDIKNWNDKKKCVGLGDKSANDKNLIIENILARINNVIVKYRLRDRKLTRASFLKAYNHPDDYKTFFEFVSEYQKKESLKLEYSTFKTNLSVIKKLKEYNQDLHFDDITNEWLDGYFSYLMHDLDNNLNTAFKNMATIKKYVTAAHNAGYMDDTPFRSWKIKKGLPSGEYLSEDELQTLMGIYINGELDYKYHKALEFFLFLCFSSLHIGDAKKLSLEQFTDDTFTYFRIKLKNRKPFPIQVPISDPLRQLLRNICGTRKKGPLFEKLPSDQTMNRFLKEIAAIACIKKNVTHKVGRHTFATIFLRKTKDITSLKEILGHSDLRETLVYAHVLNESKREGVQCFNCFTF